MAEQVSLPSSQSITSEPDQSQDTSSRVFFMMLERAGTFGNYQKLTTLVYCIIGYLCGGLMLIIPFLFYQDPYECKETVIGSTCFDYVCNLDPSERAAYIPPKTMYTLANEFGDYRCSNEKLALDSIITLMYVGAVVGYVLMTLVGDLVGRKSLLSICMCATVIGMGITIFCVNITMAGVGLFLATVGIQNAFNICFYFIAETIS